jgi:hypothetical protein
MSGVRAPAPIESCLPGAQVSLSDRGLRMILTTGSRGEIAIATRVGIDKA